MTCGIGLNLDGSSREGTWQQAERDLPSRRAMIRDLVDLLHLQHMETMSAHRYVPIDRMPQLAQKLEVVLYRDAPSLAVYQDRSTLLDRLRELAREVQKRTAGADSAAETVATTAGGATSNDANTAAASA